jgi:hypothetical protein
MAAFASSVVAFDCDRSCLQQSTRDEPLLHPECGLAWGRRKPEGRADCHYGLLVKSDDMV